MSKMMSNTRYVVAAGAALALLAFAPKACAQDDLDALLKDLESEAPAKKAEAKPAVKAEAKEEAKSEVKEEAKAEAKAEAKEEAKVEVKEEAKEEAKAEVKEEAKAEVKEEAKTEAKEEAKAEVKEETKSEAKVEAKAEEKAEAKEEAKEEVKSEAKEETKAEKPAEKVVEKPAAPVHPEAELLANISETERLRRTALDAQAKNEIAEARSAMSDGEYNEAVKHYGLANKLLNDRPASKNLKRECEQGIAEGLYRGALQEDQLGRRDRAVELMEKAIDMRHPKARRTLERWNAEAAAGEKKEDISDITHRLNDEDYKQQREQIRRHLRRSRHYLAVRDMEKALEEVEVVLVNDPYNQEAIRLRRSIQKKRRTILMQEREAAREGMIADVDEAWRPVYAVNAAQLNEAASETVKQNLGEDPERTQEQDIERRMKEMRLPTISFKPPATIMDAVEFFRQASKDYDRPDIPMEKRGFNFVLKTPQPLKAAAGEGEGGGDSDDFSSNDSEKGAAPANGLDPIPTITASDITFHEALKLVCDSVDYKFIVRGPVVMVMQKDMSTAELLSRKYDVLDAFLERMTAASSDVKEMKSQGFGGGGNKKAEEGDENQERDWKEFFSQMGVKWPEGSSIMYIKTLGKLYVRNTRENLAEFEKVLQEMGSQPKLIEIETRFVEVSQEDLNSLGFEWILNSDYSLNLGNSLGRALGLKQGVFGSESGSTTFTSDSSGSLSGSRGQNASWSQDVTSDNGRLSTSSFDSTGTSGSSGSSASSSAGMTSTYSKNVPLHSSGSGWIQDYSGTRGLGVNAFGGTSDYSNGNRYLSTESNPISGASKSTNDQFMRVNAFLGSADLSMILHMLSQRTDTDLLSAPKVVTKSGENAVIKVVTEYIYPQDYDVQLQSSSSSGGGGSSSGGSSSAILAVVEPQNFTMREVGVILDVTPTYSEANGGTIDLELKPSVVEEPTWKDYGMKIPFTGNPSQSVVSLDWLTSIPGALESMNNAVSQLINAQADTIAQQYVNAGIESMNPNTITYYDAPMEQPWFHVRSIDTKVSITPGATVVMGGLITEQRKAMDDKIPFLGDLPYIGRLFRNHAEQTDKRNLLIFVTGRLITPSGRELSVGAETGADQNVKEAPKAE